MSFIMDIIRENKCSMELVMITFDDCHKGIYTY